MIILNPDKKIGIISPSWNGPGLFNFVFEKGISEVRRVFGKEIVYSHHCIQKDKPSYKERAQDLHDMFENDEIDLIIASIGGDDSLQIIPFLNVDLLNKKSKGKIIMGYSDTTNLLLFLNSLGIETIHGPTIMSGFAEMDGITKELEIHINDFFFNKKEDIVYPFFNFSVFKNNPWENQELFEKGKTSYDVVNSWHIIQGGQVTGNMYGGSLESINLMIDHGYFDKITKHWNNSIFFLETSEEKPSISYLKVFFERPEVKDLILKSKAFIMGYFSYYSEEDKNLIRELIKHIIVEEYLYKGIIITDVQIGHSRPQWLIVEGGLYTIDSLTKKFILHK